MAKAAPDHPVDTVSDAALRRFVGYNLKRAFNALQADLSSTLEPFGLRMLTFSALALIVENPGLRPSQLAEALSVERANVAVYVDQLEEAGWVTRRPSVQDRRAYALHATLSGARVYGRASQAVERHDRRMLAGLREADLAAVNRTFAAIEAQGKGA
ncbi:MarR family transcriptional regulator [uncultured Tateyamaria sp.]|uniref:MarR family winged helix-turn-helix transcriptional regulator n=1 Tax=uncultured Tateyamaria sp. TaxID=455651 RepID=UPI00262C6DBC|nr:MarR family transcriptional regulator [uncultured Tateyamaria sp.]